MTTPDEKFIVFKKSDWESYLAECNRLDEDRDLIPDGPEPLGDAVVIRTKDRFAGPALHAYAGAVLGEAEAITSVGDRRETLMTVADYMHERAVEADDKRRLGSDSLPD